VPLTVTWTDLAVRIACTLIAGALIGYNRGEHGKAAGLRTTILVGLAASLAMLQVNYLLPMSGKSTTLSSPTT
jgi:putative Mg2+ transporter-C (MgtC) family protein